MKPLAIDLFCGLGGWTEGLLAEGYNVIGFDIERHVYGDQKYPAQLVLQDVLTLHGSQFHNAALIVASPPCQEYSLWSMKMFFPDPPVPDMRLWEAAVRIGQEAGVPTIIENVRGAQYWHGRANWKCGPYYLWGSTPALFPSISVEHKRVVDDVKKGVRRGVCPGRKFSSKPRERKELTARAAKIPLDLARYIASVYKPEAPAAASVTERSVEVQ